jgi:hypothetical protein
MWDELTKGEKDVYIDERPARSRRAFWPSNTEMESQNGQIYL